jgi:PilZ domain
MPLSPSAYEQVLLACVTSNTERRDTTRTGIVSNAPLYRCDAVSNQLMSIELNDVSSEGMGFTSPRELQSGERVMTELPRVGQEALQLFAEVRHCRRIGENRYLIGARFVSDEEKCELSKAPSRTKIPSKN